MSTKLFAIKLRTCPDTGADLYLSGTAPRAPGGPAEATGDVQLATKRSTYADAQLLAERFGGEVVEVGG